MTVMEQYIKDLNETQILAEIRKNFSGETLEGITVDEFISSSSTLSELLARIQQALDKRNAG